MTSHVRKRSVRGKPLCALWTVFLYAAARPWKSSYGMEVIMRHMFVTLPTLALSWQHAAENGPGTPVLWISISQAPIHA